MTRQQAKVVRAVLAFIVTSVVSGYIVGRALSPNFNDPTDGPALVRTYVVNSLQTRYETSLVRCDRRAPVVRVEARTMEFGCGIRSFTFHRDARLTVGSLDDERVRWWKTRRGFRFDEAVSIVAGGAGTYALLDTIPALEAAVTRASRLGKVRILTTAALSVVSGFAFGYWVGYEPAPRCGEQVFQKTISDGALATYVAAKSFPQPTYVGLPALNDIRPRRPRPSVTRKHSDSRVSRYTLRARMNAYDEANRGLDERDVRFSGNCGVAAGLTVGQEQFGLDYPPETRDEAWEFLRPFAERALELRTSGW